MIEFYNVRKKTKVSIDESKVEKKTYEKVSKAGKKLLDMLLLLLMMMALS